MDAVETPPRSPGLQTSVGFIVNLSGHVSRHLQRINNNCDTLLHGAAYRNCSFEGRGQARMCGPDVFDKQTNIKKVMNR
jgi:hypothetical protein